MDNNTIIWIFEEFKNAIIEIFCDYLLFNIIDLK